MKRTTRDRLLLPIVLPVGIVLVIALLLFGFSRILLAIPHDAATATALVVALAIVVVAGVVAGRQYVRLSSLAGMVGAVAGVAMLAGGIAIASLDTAGEGPGGGEGGGAGPTVVTIVAANIAFQQTEITVPAGEPFRIRFINQDAGVQHNVEIFDNPDFAGTPLFAGEIITGASEIVYDVPALDAGTYPFNCVVHPNMTGTITAVEVGGGGGESPSPTTTSTSEPPPTSAPPPGDAIEVTAQGVRFDTAQIVLPANRASTIHFVNDDAGIQHNIVIATDDTLAEILFDGDLITGVSEIDYQVPPIEPGTYYFVCIVHPNMNGVVTVA